MKKLLALVLALVMTLGLATVGANAATTYSDADDISYKKAVDVMSAIGVLAGSDGAFNPKGILTREQGAKIITYMLVGGQTAGDALTTTTAPFDDVAADRWSAGSIAYCKTLGIVGGVGDNKFDPTGTLTGYQFAKMLLVALGYDAEIEKLGGSDWALNVAKLVTNINLSDDIAGFSGNVGVTREIAAQLGYNTLRSTMVYYASSTEVGTGGSSVNTSLQTSNVPNTATTYETNGRGLTATPAASTDGAPVDTMQLCEKYFPKLKLNTAAKDDFDRPASKWTLGGVNVGTYAKTPVVTYTEYMDTVEGRKQIKNDLGDYDRFDSISAANAGATTNVTLWVNGAQIGGLDQADTQADTIAEMTGNGRAVEIYVSNNALTDIVIVDTVVGQVTKVDAKAEKLTITFATSEGAKDLDDNGGAEAKMAAGAVAEKGGVVGTWTVSTDKGYGTFKKDDYVLVTFTSADGYIDGDADETIRSIAAPEVVTGIASTKNDSANEYGTISVGGTVYKAAYAIDGANNVKKFAVSNSKEATLLLDANGFVVGAKAGTTTISDKSVVVLDEYYSLDGDGKQVCMIKGVTADGETVRWITNQTTGTANYTKGAVYTYATNSSGKYVLTANVANFATATTTGSESVTGDETSKYTVKVVKTSSEIKASTKVLNTTDLGNTVYVDDDTNFIFVNNTSGSWKTTTVAGAQKVAEGTTIHVALKKNTSDNTWHAAAVYVLGTDAPVSAGSASDVVFVNGAPDGTTQVTDSSNGKAVTRTIYNAWVDGEEAENFYAKDGASTGFYTIDKNADTGEYNLTAATRYASTSGSYAVTGYGVIDSVKNNTLITSTGNYNVAGAAFIDTATEKGDTYDNAAAVQEKIDTTAGSLAAFVMYNASTGAASYVYIVNAATFNNTMVGGGQPYATNAAMTAALNKALKEQGGATITGTFTAGAAIEVPLGATLTIDGANTLDMATYKLTVKGTLKAAAAAKIDADGYTENAGASDYSVSVEGGTINMPNGEIDATGKTVYSKGGATLDVKTIKGTKLIVGCSVTVANLTVSAIDILGDDPTSKLVVTDTLDDVGTSGINVTMAGTGSALDLSGLKTDSVTGTIAVTVTGAAAAIDTSSAVTLDTIDASGAAADVTVSGQGTVATATGSVGVEEGTKVLPRIEAPKTKKDLTGGSYSTNDGNWTQDVAIDAAKGTIVATTAISKDFCNSGAKILNFDARTAFGDPSDYAEGFVVLKLYAPNNAVKFDLTGRDKMNVNDAKDEGSQGSDAVIYTLVGVKANPSNYKVRYYDSEDHLISEQNFVVSIEKSTSN